MKQIGLMFANGKQFSIDTSSDEEKDHKFIMLDNGDVTIFNSEKEFNKRLEKERKMESGN